MQVGSTKPQIQPLTRQGNHRYLIGGVMTPPYRVRCIYICCSGIRGQGKGSAGFCDKNWDSLFTFRGFSCIVTPEQSRRQRVKCHRDGEFARRTKEISTMLSPHPLLHTGNPPLCSNDTRSGEWSAVYCCPFPTGDPYPDSLAALRRGGFFVYGCTGLCPD